MAHILKFKDMHDNPVIINIDSLLSATLTRDITTGKYTNVLVYFKHYQSSVTFKFKTENDAKNVIETIFIKS